jgi:hypothetical protein
VVDVDTFLTTLYVMVDDFCHSRPQKQHPGPDASLSPSEVITLAIFARWARFRSERDFYRYASARLIDAFPTLPERSQFNRLVRHSLGLIKGLIEEIALHLADMMKAQRCPYQALDSSAMPVRDAKRRGEGWLAGRADIGWSKAWDGTKVSVCSWPQRSHRRRHGLRLLCRFHRRPAGGREGGRDLLRHATSNEPSAAERRIGLLFGSLGGRQGLRGRRKP